MNIALMSFVASMLGGIIPINKSSLKHGKWMHYLDAFCDAMFVAIALGHLLPEIFHHNSTPSIIFLLSIIILTTFGIQRITKRKDGHFQYLCIAVFFGHCFMEGLAVPIISDHHVQTTLSLAVVVHKVIEPFIFFNLLSRQYWSKKQLSLLLVVFSSLTPIGIFAGSYLTYLPAMLNSIITALTCGTFLGISTNCYFNNSCHDHSQQKWLSAALLLLSFILVSFLGHGHSH